MQRQYIYKFIFFKLWMPKFKAGFTLWLNWCPPLPPLSQTTKESELNPKQSEPEVKTRTFSLRCQKAALPSPGECDSTDLGLTRRGQEGWAEPKAPHFCQVLGRRWHCWLGHSEPLCSQSLQGSGDIMHTLLKPRSRKYSLQKSWLLQNRVILGLPWWLSSKESACNAGDSGLIPGSGRSLGEGNGNPL